MSDMLRHAPVLIRLGFFSTLLLDTMDTLAHLQVLIQNQRRSVRWQLAFTSGLFVLGLSLLIAGFFIPLPATSDYFKTVLGLAGAFTASVCAFPLKEVNACRDRLSVYHSLRTQIDAHPEEDREKIDSLVWEVLKKTAGG